ncbi:MAG: helix-turn-helix transcriptional regulator [Halofilum sp. (in: g-proteobacteria)]|nr:helix-turn-helix transcriptional regulator [Halofilum sp. (in: g-proteobacteria)]
MQASDRERAVETFRRRLQELIERGHASRSAFAAHVGMDRSTLSQLLSADNERLPRAETVIAIARAAQVSVDWLLGLSQDEQRGAELLRGDLEIAAGAASPVDERLARWHQEARGYKVRYVPTTVPDLLKTEAVIAHEAPPAAEPAPVASPEQTARQLRYSRNPDTEMEVCCPQQTLAALARGEGVWQGLEAAARRAQIEHMIALVEELYPSFRWSLYDGRRHFSVPVTVFGPQRAVVYVGNLYLVFNTTEYIQVLAAHFDGLVKAATVPPTGLRPHLEDLLGQVR